MRLQLSPFGKSDHVCQKWKLVVEDVIFRDNFTPRFNFKKADWTSLKAGLKNFAFQEADSPSVMNEKLIHHINKLKAQCIPLC